MFTGIVESTGKVKKIEHQGELIKLSIEAPALLENIKNGDSIAVNGVCLTVVSFDENAFQVEVVPATLQVTSLGELVEGDLVNLERALQVGSRLDGHYVQGHVDGVGLLQSLEKHDEEATLRFQIPENVSQYLVPRGSVTVDGISLTLQQVEGNTCEIAIIPHTLEVTNLKNKKVGDRLNFEVDILGKYVFHYLKNSVISN